MSAPKAVETLYCSFCSKSHHEVERLIAGPAVFICNECVGICGDIVADCAADSRLRKAMRERGSIVVSKTDAEPLAWMKTWNVTGAPDAADA